MKRIETVLKIVHKKVTKEDWDNCLIIAGDEGTGKSNMALHILEWWLTKQYGKVVPEDIKFNSLDREQFIKNLRDCKRFDLPVFDESGELSNKRSMSKFNVTISQAYQVIRGDNLFTILVLPSLFDLEGFFTKRRARGLIQVYKRGRFAYWDKQRLRKLVALNQKRYIKSVWCTAPLFYDTFPIYKGVMAEPYKLKKAEKIKNVRNKLYDDLTKENKKSERDALIPEMVKELGKEKTAKIVGVKIHRINQILQKAKQGGK